MENKRNDPCPCGSGKKYKKCCGLKEAQEKASQARPRNFFLPNFGSDAPGSKGSAINLAKKLIRVLESEEAIVAPSYIPESHASTKEAENPELIPPGVANTLS